MGFKELLRRNGVRATTNRVNVLRALSAAKTAVSVPHITEVLDDDPKIVRLKLAELSRIGLAERVERPPSPFGFWRLRRS